jgi:hypothetical protein
MLALTRSCSCSHQTRSTCQQRCQPQVGNSSIPPIFRVPHGLSSARVGPGCTRPARCKVKGGVPRAMPGNDSCPPAAVCSRASKMAFPLVDPGASMSREEPTFGGPTRALPQHQTRGAFLLRKPHDHAFHLWEQQQPNTHDHTHTHARAIESSPGHPQPTSSPQSKTSRSRSLRRFQILIN